jgi:outer membrane protein W
LTASLLLLAGANAGWAQPTGSSPNLNAIERIDASTASAERSLAGRHRLELRFGYWDPGHQSMEPMPTDYMDDFTRVEDVVGAFSYSYWVHDQLATDVTFTAMVVEVTSSGSYPTGSESAVVLTSAMFGFRLYPLSSAQTPLRPYVSGGIGPYLGIESYKEYHHNKFENVKSLGAFGGYMSAGMDIQMGRHLMAGVQVGYNVMSDFREPIGFKDNYEGYVVSAGLSLLIGKGEGRR